MFWVPEHYCKGSKLNAVRLIVGPILTRRNNLKREEDYLQVRSISNNIVSPDN
jgi:hypothetical protein